MTARNGRWILAVVATTIPGLADQAARADTRDFDAAGTGLAVIEACAHHVAITVDPALSGRIAMTADAVHPEEIAQIVVATVDGQARVGLRPTSQKCWTPQSHGSFDRTLTLRIRIPAGFPVSVTESGLGDYGLGAVGALTVSASGMMTLVADNVHGDTRLDLSGADSIGINRLDTDRFGAALSGTGSLRIRDGRIGAVTLSDSGATQVRIDPVVETADLASSGVGSISMGGVHGALHRAISGLGRITVAGQPPSGQEDGGN